MTKLTEAANEEECNHFGNPNSFKSGWLAALEEVAKALEFTKRDDSEIIGECVCTDCEWLIYKNSVRSSLRAEIFKAIEELKK